MTGVGPVITVRVDRVPGRAALIDLLRREDDVLRVVEDGEDAIDGGAEPPPDLVVHLAWDDSAIEVRRPDPDAPLVARLPLSGPPGFDELTELVARIRRAAADWQSTERPAGSSSPTRLVLCCDGTWTDPTEDTAIQQLCSRASETRGPDGAEQRRLYIEGVSEPAAGTGCAAASSAPAWRPTSARATSSSRRTTGQATRSSCSGPAGERSLRGVWPR